MNLDWLRCIQSIKQFTTTQIDVQVSLGTMRKRISRTHSVIQFALWLTAGTNSSCKLFWSNWRILTDLQNLLFLSLPQLVVLLVNQIHHSRQDKNCQQILLYSMRIHYPFRTFPCFLSWIFQGLWAALHEVIFLKAEIKNIPTTVLYILCCTSSAKHSAEFEQTTHENYPATGTCLTSVSFQV